jgi:hypothetical protein
MPVVPAWAKHKAWADHLAAAVAAEPRGWHTAADLRRCAERLGVELRYTEGDQLAQRVTSAHFCHHRMCPVCSWRKVQAWRRRLIPGFEQFHQAHPKHRPVFLTLTVRNCRLEELAPTLAELHGAWARMTKRRGFPTSYWLRRTEITIGRPAIGDDGAPNIAPQRIHMTAAQSADMQELRRAPYTMEQNQPPTVAASAAIQKRYAVRGVLPAGSELSGGAWLHPHIHALLMVPARYFKADYIRQELWRQWWMESARLDYAPVVDIRRGYVKGENISDHRASVAAAIEAAKYISKASEVAALGPDLVEVERQLKGARMIAVSRALGAYVRPDAIDGAEMVDPEPQGPSDGLTARLMADWDAAERAYVLNLP